MGLIERQRYTFGNDKFSLEDAYHDCKLVFDGITDDDSFQEADKGLILYYANEIIYALHEALQGKGINVLSNDTISRQPAIDALRVAYWDDKIQSAKDDPCIVDAMTDWAIRQVKALPSAQPEQKTAYWKTHIFDGIMGGRPRTYMCGYCNFVSLAQTNYCSNCGAKMEVEHEA